MYKGLRDLGLQKIKVVLNWNCNSRLWKKELQGCHTDVTVVARSLELANAGSVGRFTSVNAVSWQAREAHVGMDSQPNHETDMGYATELAVARHRSTIL